MRPLPLDPDASGAPSEAPPSRSGIAGRGTTLLAAVVFLAVYLAPLGSRELLTPDETRYAEIAREMTETGDWIVPRLNGLRYFEKPALGYWLTALSLLLFGENPFAARLPSALAAAGTLLAVAALARRHAPGPAHTAVLAAVILMTSAEFFLLGVTTLPDGPFTLFVTLAMGLFFTAHAARSDRSRRLALAGLGACCGLAFLTKGLLGIAIPGMVVLPFLLWQGGWRPLLAAVWIPALAALLVILPWAIAIHLREPDFWPHFILAQHVSRFVSPETKTQHAQPFWYLIPVLVGGALPWSLAAPAAVRGIRIEGLRAPLLRYCLLWAFVPFLFFSISKGKLGTYVLPCFPPLSILLAVGLGRALDAGRDRAFVGACIALACLGGAGTLLVAADRTVGIRGLSLYPGSDGWKAAVLVTALALLLALAVLAIRMHRPRPRLAAFAAGPAVLYLALPFVLPEPFYAERAPRDLLRNAGRVRPDDLLVADSHVAPAVCWYLGRSDVALLRSGGEMTYGLEYPDASNRLLMPERFAREAADPHRTGAIRLVTSLDRFETRYAPIFPPPKSFATARGLVLVEY